MNQNNNLGPILGPILGIETSCDETAVAIFDPQKGIISSKLFSQITLHKQYGGVVPEIASRSHIEKINHIISETLSEAQMTLNDIDIIGVTTNPGLPGSLLVGLCFAKGIVYGSQITDKPKKLIGINHLEGHIYSACIEHTIPFPFICLTVSGGHTSLYLVHSYLSYELLGTTVDDAAGEAFDKISKLMNLGYPGGPIIEKLAEQAGFQDYFHYPRLRKKSLAFSFSGLKTAVLYDLIDRGAYDLENKTFLASDDLLLQQKVASSLLVCIKDIFIERLGIALKEYPHVKAIAFVGGVACNKYLRHQLALFAHAHKIEFFTPTPHYCTDNAGMIAFVAYQKALNNSFDTLSLDIF